MYLLNKYTTWYNRIIANAQARVIDGYTEKHHIIPKSFGGSNKKENLVSLTAREHFICHWLLTKMTTSENKAKMMFALKSMQRETQDQHRYTTKITARVYASLKGHLRHTKETKAKMSEMKQGYVPWNKGKTGIYSDETRKKISAAGKGRKHSEETKAKMKLVIRSEEFKENLRNRVCLPETRAKLSEANKGKKRPCSEETKRKISETKRKRKNKSADSLV